MFLATGPLGCHRKAARGAFLRAAASWWRTRPELVCWWALEAAAWWLVQGMPHGGWEPVGNHSGWWWLTGWLTTIVHKGYSHQAVHDWWWMLVGEWWWTTSNHTKLARWWGQWNPDVGWPRFDTGVDNDKDDNIQPLSIWGFTDWLLPQRYARICTYLEQKWWDIGHIRICTQNVKHVKPKIISPYRP